MPTSYKTRLNMAKAMKKTYKRRTVNASVTRAIRSMTGANYRRQTVSLPAVLRSRGNMATELKSIADNSYCTEAGGTALNMYSPSAGVTAAVLLDMPVEGSSFYNRIARRTRGVSLEIVGHIKPTLTNSAQKPLQFGRVMIIYDRQANGAVPSVSTIIADYPSGGTAATYSTSGINPDNRDRFQVLRDRKFLLPPIGVNGVAPTTTSANLSTTNGDIKESCFTFNEYIKLNGAETQYKASTGGGIGDIATGSYLILVMAENDTSTSAYALTYRCSYKFYD